MRVPEEKEKERMVVVYMRERMSKNPPQTTVPSGMVALASTVTMPERM